MLVNTGMGCVISNVDNHQGSGIILAHQASFSLVGVLWGQVSLIVEKQPQLGLRSRPRA